MKFKVINHRGEEEIGEGDGVSRDIICSFFTEFITSNTLGCLEVVPAIRHTMLLEDWQAVARIMLYGLRLNYFPVRLSLIFMQSALFGESF